MPEALEEWHRLDGSIKVLLKKLLGKRLDEPHVPGGALHGPLSGCYKIKLRQHGVRLIYAVRDEQLVVTVIAVARRENDEAYVLATLRVRQAPLMADAPGRRPESKP